MRGDRLSKPRHAIVHGRTVSVASVFSTLVLDAAVHLLAQHLEGDPTLDLGCGRRPYRLHLPREALGIDLFPVPQAVDAVADVSALPIRSGSSRAILCTEVLEHVSSPRRTMHEIERVLSPGGSVVFSTPFVHEIHEWPHDYQRFTVYGIRQLAGGAGLEVVSEIALGGAAHVVLDLVFRGAARQIRRGAKLAPRGARTADAVLVSLQRAVGRRSTRHVAVTRQAIRAAEMGPSLTLGYVVLARKPSNTTVNSA